MHARYSSLPFPALRPFVADPLLHLLRVCRPSQNLLARSRRICAVVRVCVRARNARTRSRVFAKKALHRAVFRTERSPRPALLYRARGIIES